MKKYKLSFDITDNPKLLDLLRVYSATSGKSQKAILIEALTCYFDRAQENDFLVSAANKSFSEWINPEDEIYDSF